MYNPISLNVVRQSLEWMGIPKPLAIKRHFGPFKWPNGNITTTYRLSFQPGDVQHAIGYGNLECDQDLNPFVDALRECFMEDMRIVEQHYDRESHEVWFLLNTTHTRNAK